MLLLALFSGVGGLLTTERNEARTEGGSQDLIIHIGRINPVDDLHRHSSFETSCYFPRHPWLQLSPPGLILLTTSSKTAPVHCHMALSDDARRS